MVQPADDRDGEPGRQVERGHLPAQQAEEQDERHFVHHRRGDEEREGDPERNAGRHEPDEERHGGAGTERRDRAEEGRQHVAGRFPAAREDPPGAFGREEGADDADAEDDQHQQHQHLGRFVDEELDGRGEVGSRLEAGEPIGDPSGHAREVAVRPRSRRLAAARPAERDDHRRRVHMARCYYISLYIDMTKRRPPAARSFPRPARRLEGRMPPMVYRRHHSSPAGASQHHARHSRRRLLRRMLAVGPGPALPGRAGRHAAPRAGRPTCRLTWRSRRTCPSASRSSSRSSSTGQANGVRPRFSGAVHASGLPHRPRRRRRGGVPLPRVAVPGGRHGRGRARHAVRSAAPRSNRMPAPADGLPVPPEPPGPGPIVATPRGARSATWRPPPFVVAAASGVAVAVPYDTRRRLRVDRRRCCWPIRRRRSSGTCTTGAGQAVPAG